LTVTLQVPVPEQPPPDHPVNVECGFGVAISVTCVPWSNRALHVEPHEIPTGELLTDPDPLPAFETVSLRWAANVAVTSTSAFTVTVQGDVVPVHVVDGSPVTDQPAKREPLAVAVNVTVSPSVYGSEQTPPLLVQPLIAPWSASTLPLPAPSTVTVSVCVTVATKVTAEPFVVPVLFVATSRT
jgi:hypothetical protein